MEPNCLFCKIIERKIPAAIEYEDEAVLIFKDINPQAPVHVLAIPKRHTAGPSDLNQLKPDSALLGGLFFKVAEFARSRGLQDYRLVVNNGPQAGQTVFHLHVHLLSGRGMAWPPG